MLLMFSYHASYVSSMAYSSPSIVIDAGRTPEGKRVQYDDYREAYFWLRQNTHEDAKILSWWDYGYQMSAMANRTAPHINSTVILASGHCWHVSPRTIGAYPREHWWHNSEAVEL
jgi:dolichyl-diphosphooligosaccharide--protein glycosyltransferase